MIVPNGAKRLDLNSSEAQELSDALDLVIEQPCYVSRGNHANLVWVMKNIFGVNLTKGEAVAGAIWALWREGDLTAITSGDAYIYELQQQERTEQYYIEMADQVEYSK